MDSHASPVEFETSEMVAIFLASTPLLRESWRLCDAANSKAPQRFVTDQQPATGGGIGYMAFSGVQMPEALSDAAWGKMVPLHSAGEGVFGPLVGATEDGKVAEVHAGLLELFKSMLQSQPFNDEILALKESSKSIVITGHSLGGSIASLTTLWLLSQYHQQQLKPPPILCITFGSPLLGNVPLTRAILRERWAPNFCHVVANRDILPRLLFAPDATLTPAMPPLLQHWNSSLSPAAPAAPILQEVVYAEFFGFIIASLEKCSSSETDGGGDLQFWPFGNFLLCSREGAICLDNAASVVKMLYLMLVSGFNPSECVDDHLKYGEYVGRVATQYVMQRGVAQGEPFGRASEETGLALALLATGIRSQEPAETTAKECLKAARRLGLAPILYCAKLAIKLAEVVPCRAQIEWYIARCDRSDKQIGYYDDFKLEGASRMRNHVNLNRHELASFWDGIIEKLEKNELPYDFPKRDKWVNALHFYKLLVEPLDIADYYRHKKHLTEGHYFSNGRPRRYQISDRWWKERRAGKDDGRQRTKFASQTQDSCFWAKLEEAREWLDQLLQSEDGTTTKLAMWENVKKFDAYATTLVEKKEVSKDVVAKNSSYMKWTEDLRKLSSQMVYIENVNVHFQ